MTDKRRIAGELAAERQLSKTHCRRGHPYDERNTYRAPKTGARACKECNKLRMRQIRHSQLAPELLLNTTEEPQ